MDQKNILIVEDEIVIANDIQDTVEDLGFNVVEIAITMNEAIQALENNPIDLVLVDITLKGNSSGIELAEIINSKYQIPFIFLTSHSDAATVKKAVQQNPDGYIVKPFDKVDLFTTIELTLHKNQAKEDQKEDNLVVNVDHIFVKDSNEYIKILHRDIYYLKASGNYIEIYTKDKKHLIRSTIKVFLSGLPQETFLQTHKSYGINVQHIQSIKTNIILIEEAEIPIGRAYKDKIREIVLGI